MGLASERYEAPLQGATSGLTSATIGVVTKQNHSDIGVQDEWKENLKGAALASPVRARTEAQCGLPGQKGGNCGGVHGVARNDAWSLGTLARNKEVKEMLVPEGKGSGAQCLSLLPRWSPFLTNLPNRFPADTH